MSFSGDCRNVFKDESVLYQQLCWTSSDQNMAGAFGNLGYFMLCYVSHIAHKDMYVFVSQLIFSSEIFHVQVRLLTLQLGRMKDSSNSLLALNGCTTRASICGILWLVISCPCHWVIILKWVSRCGIAVSTWGKQNRAIHNWPKPCHIRLQLCPLDTCCALLLLPAATSISTAQSLLRVQPGVIHWFSSSSLSCVGHWSSTG